MCDIANSPFSEQHRRGAPQVVAFCEWGEDFRPSVPLTIAIAQIHYDSTTFLVLALEHHPIIVTICAVNGVLRY